MDVEPGRFVEQSLGAALGPRCDTTGCREAAAMTYRDVELIPPKSRSAVKVGELRLCTAHARRFVIEQRVTVDWERILPDLKA